MPAKTRGQMKPRRLPRYTDDVNILLKCGCRVCVAATRMFDGPREIECPWPREDGTHGPQDWVVFEASLYGYGWECAERRCEWYRKRRLFGVNFATMIISAKAHSMATGHPVAGYADEFRGWCEVPLFLSDEIPF